MKLKTKSQAQKPRCHNKLLEKIDAADKNAKEVL